MGIFFPLPNKKIFVSANFYEKLFCLSLQITNCSQLKNNFFFNLKHVIKQLKTLSQNLFGNAKAPVELGNPNTCA